MRHALQVHTGRRCEMDHRVGEKRQPAADIDTVAHPAPGNLAYPRVRASAASVTAGVAATPPWRAHPHSSSALRLQLGSALDTRPMD